MEQKNRMFDLGKYGIFNEDKLIHRKLIKTYQLNFNPLLLPKLAILGYRIKPDPSCQIFLSKIQLFDRAGIQRENMYLKSLKEFVTAHLEQEKEAKENIDSDKKILRWKKEKQIKSCINFEEERYLYGKILTNRLTDLNQFIFHIERMKGQPELQRQCKQLLQKEINRINSLKTQFKRLEKYNHQNYQIDEKKLFNLNDYRLNEKTERTKLINQVYENKNKHKMHNKVSTEPSHFDYDMGYYQESNKDTFRISVDDQIIEGQESPNRQKQFVKNRFSMAEYRSKLKEFKQGEKYSKNTESSNYQNKRKSTATGCSEIDSKGETSARNKLKKYQKSVKYNIINNTDSCENEEKIKLTSIANLKSSRSIRDKSQKNIKFNDYDRKHNNGKSKRKMRDQSKKSIKCEFDSKLQICDDDLQNFRGGKKLKSVKFSEDFQEQKKDYVQSKSQIRGPKLRKQGRLKIFDTNIFNDIEDEEVPISMQNRFTKSKPARQHYRNFRRQALLQDFSLQTPATARPLSTKHKRKGRILGVQANKNLQRLLMEDNIQQMLLQHELHEQANSMIIKKGLKNKGKNNEGMLGSTKHIISRKNNILMQVDIQAQQNQNTMQKLKLKGDQYVNSEGFSVNPTDLVTMRQKFIEIKPYHHQTIATYYGGQQLQHVNSQFIMNQFGQYSFNRQFIQDIKKTQQQYQPHNFAETDRFESIKFDFCKALCRNQFNIQQKSIGKSSFLVN